MTEMYFFGRSNFKLSPDPYDGTYEDNPNKLASSTNELCELKFYPDLHVPSSIELVTSNNNLEKIHMPTSNAIIEILSKELTDAIATAGTVDWHLVPVHFIDKETRQEKCKDRYNAVFFNELCDCFDYEKSDYKTRDWSLQRGTERDKKYMTGLVKKRVFRKPEGGYPPLFRDLAERTRLYVSAKGHEAINDAKIDGVRMVPIQ